MRTSAARITPTPADATKSGSRERTRSRSRSRHAFTTKTYSRSPAYLSREAGWEIRSRRKLGRKEGLKIAKKQVTTSTCTQSPITALVFCLFVLWVVLLQKFFLPNLDLTFFQTLRTEVLKIFRETKTVREIIQFCFLYVVVPIYGFINLRGVDPREHIISVQTNVIMPEQDDDNSNDKVDDAWPGCIMWQIISEKPATEIEFQQILAKARKKPLVLQEECPTMGLMDIGPFNINNLAWNHLYGLVSSLLCNTPAIVKGACNLEVNRYRMIYCLTFESSEQVGYNSASRKMRVLLVSRKQLKILHMNPNYGLNDHRGRSYAWSSVWQQQRMQQLKELGQHVANTGGFDDETYVQENLNRYYGTVEVWM